MTLKLVRQPAKCSETASKGGRPKNAAVRDREFLSIDEYRALVAAARKTGRYGARDAALIQTMFRHGLRVSEACNLTWDRVTFGRSCTIHVTRQKNGTPSTHTMTGEEVRQLKQLQRDQQPPSRFVFCSNRGTPMSRITVYDIVKRAGEAAGIPFPIHPHMLRHSKGHQLAQRGEDTRAIQAFLGHRRIESTTVYTQLDPSRFRDFSDD